MSKGFVWVPLTLWEKVRNIPSDRLPTGAWDAIQAVPLCWCCTAEDLGVSPEIAAPDMIAHYHPECPTHGRVR